MGEEHAAGDENDQNLLELVNRLTSYLKELEVGIEQTVGKYDRESYDEAKKMLEPLAEGIDWSLRSILQTSAYLLDHGHVVDVEKIQNCATALAEAFSSKDRIQIPDVLRHELIPVISRQRRSLRTAALQQSAEGNVEQINLAALEAHQVETFDFLFGEDASSGEPPNTPIVDMELVRARFGGYGLVVSALLDEDAPEAMVVNSIYDPGQDAERWAKMVLSTRPSVVLVFGFSLGYHLRSLLEMATQEIRVLVFEPDVQLFQEMIKHIFVADLLAQAEVTLLVGDSTTLEAEVGKHLSILDISGLSTQVLPNYVTLYPNESSEWFGIVQSRSRSMVSNVATRFFMKTHWLTNAVKNFSHLPASYTGSDVHGAWKGKPAIIVSPGPSLQKNVSQLKAIADRCLILATDSAMSVLADHGIRPHIFITMDAQPIVARKLDGLDFEELPVASWIRAQPEIMKQHNGPKLIMATGDLAHFMTPLLEAMNMNSTRWQTGSSVAHTALGVAQIVLADPVIFIGQDLAYTGGKSHHDNHPFLETVENAQRDIIWVEGTHEEKVPTSKGLYYDLNNLGLMMEGSDLSYIDATEGGARIAHTTVMDLEEAINTYVTGDPIEENPFNRTISSEVQMERRSEMVVFLEETVRAVSQHSERCQGAVDLIQDSLDVLNGSLYVDAPDLIKDLFGELEALEAVPDEDVLYISVLEAIILPMSIRLSRKMSRLDATEITVEDAIEQLLFAVEYYKGHQQAAHTFVEMCNELTTELAT